MTLIIGGANTEFAFLVSDRRFTYTNRYRDDEKNKLIAFTLRDSRCLVAFTGLAEWEQFQTAHWLTRALSDAAVPDLTLPTTMTRLTQAATEQFKTLNCRADVKRLSIVASGYWHDISPARAFFFRISNFETNGQYYTEAKPEFTLLHRVQGGPASGEPHFLFAAGARVALPSDWKSIADLLKDRKKAEAIVNKTVSVIRAAADSPKAGGTIGKQCNSGFIERDTPRTAVEYHPVSGSSVIYMPDVVVRNGRMGIVSRGAKIEAFHDDGTPRQQVIPRVHRNAPCPCGSGKKYRECHGTPKRQV